ncbi:hypothetical protein IIO_04894 [Bacillus cereus VD115]|nr:hypothetical protein IIO_04894 [Bacillus cereus VD115]
MKYSPRSTRLSGINVYMTNTSTDIVPMGQVHDWYSLRWQIEILFKTWKSFFQMRQLLLIKKERELSEYKAIYMIKDYFLLLFQTIQKKHPRAIRGVTPPVQSPTAKRVEISSI